MSSRPLTAQQQQQQLQLRPLLQGQEVDAAIMEERERDINKLNRDMVLVNEMYKYVRIVLQSLSLIFILSCHPSNSNMYYLLLATAITI